jgi:hypothetical protein
VTKRSNALDLEQGVFALDDPREIARSLQRSADRSSRSIGGSGTRRRSTNCENSTEGNSVTHRATSADAR